MEQGYLACGQLHIPQFPQ